MISVIVPVYKVEKQLGKCIESICNQTYKDLEIILVNDGSPDSCGDICDNYAKIDNRIKVIHKKNGGLSSARNAGLDVASGDYIGFVDSDDYINSEMYRTMLDKIESETADLCICDLEYIDTNDNIIEKKIKSPIKNEILNKLDVLNKICLSEGGYFYYVTAVNKLYKRELFENLRFPIGKLHEDEFIAHHIFGKCEKVVTIDNKFYFYVQNVGSIMNSKYSVKRLDGALAFYDRFLYLKSNGLTKQAKQSLISFYGLLSYGVSKVVYIKNKKAINPLLKKMLGKSFLLGLRSIKFWLKFLKKYFIELISHCRFKINSIKPIKRNNKKGQVNVILIATPTHGNLGDQAIVFAEKQFLINQNYKPSQIVEVKNFHFLNFGDEILNHIKKEDIIIVDGGGNLGTLWPNEDDKISNIIKTFDKNKIVIFPETMYYDNGKEAEARLERNRQVYYSHPNLTICLREEASYQYAKSQFSDVNLVLCPDIVLFIDNLKTNQKRKGILLCFRKDLEKVVTDEFISSIESKIKEKGVPYKHTSTIIDEAVTKKNRNKALMKKFKEFASARLVVTDRLHAMIFSAITNTPCIALDNKSKKITGVYKWIEDLEYIECARSFDEVFPLIEKLYKIEQCKYEILYELFEKLEKEL